MLKTCDDYFYWIFTVIILWLIIIFRANVLKKRSFDSEIFERIWRLIIRFKNWLNANNIVSREQDKSFKIWPVLFGIPFTGHQLGNENSIFSMIQTLTSTIIENYELDVTFPTRQSFFYQSQNLNPAYVFLWEIWQSNCTYFAKHYHLLFNQTLLQFY